jgi:hypothetical protein
MEDTMYVHRWASLLVGILLLAPSLQAQLFPYKPERPRSDTTLAMKWEDPHYYTHPIVWDKDVPMSEVMDTLRNLKLAMHWKYYNKVVAMFARGINTVGNPMVAEMMLEAMKLYKHPYFVYLYCTAEARPYRMEEYIPFLETEFTTAADEVKYYVSLLRGE